MNIWNFLSGTDFFFYGYKGLCINLLISGIHLLTGTRRLWMRRWSWTKRWRRIMILMMIDCFKIEFCTVADDKFGEWIRICYIWAIAHDDRRHPDRSLSQLVAVPTQGHCCCWREDVGNCWRFRCWWILITCYGLIVATIVWMACRDSTIRLLLLLLGSYHRTRRHC